ncbi:MAG: biofilm synthesis protein [bacterium]|nr:MAG: biofilm synthesis protein [bacterium]
MGIKKYLTALTVLMLVPGYAGIAAAGSGTAPTVNSAVSCAITTSIKASSVGGTELSFGSIAQGEGPYDASAVISVTLTRGTGYNIKINGGTGQSMGSTNDRTLELGGSSASDVITYGLFTDAPGGTAWNVDTAYSGYTSGSGFAAQTTNIYGRITSVGSSQTTGGYSDSVTITITTE